MGHVSKTSIVCIKQDILWVAHIKPKNADGKSYSDILHGDCIIIPISCDNVKLVNNVFHKPADNYKCLVPWFTFTLSFIQCLLYFHYSLLEEYGAKHDLLERLLLCRPDLTSHAWRYVLYSLFHLGLSHFVFNVSVQLLTGIPLELLHGPFRVAIIYTTGVVAGAVISNWMNKDTVLLGSSGGVYALLAAHLADVILNYSEMELGGCKLLVVIFITILDVTLALKDQYGASPSPESAVSYTAHIAGAMVGLLTGLAILRTFSNNSRLKSLQLICLGCLLICVTPFLVLIGCLVFKGDVTYVKLFCKQNDFTT